MSILKYIITGIVIGVLLTPLDSYLRKRMKGKPHSWIKRFLIAFPVVFIVCFVTLYLADCIFQ